MYQFPTAFIKACNPFVQDLWSEFRLWTPHPLSALRFFVLTAADSVYSSAHYDGRTTCGMIVKLSGTSATSIHVPHSRLFH